MQTMRATSIIAFLMFAGCNPADAASPACTTATAACLSQVEIGTHGKLEYYRNHDLGQPNANITKLVVITHGVSRHFGDSFARMMTVYSAAQDSTLVVAPHFLADEDQPAPGYLYWAVHGWASGDDSLDPSHTSSFEALDSLVSGILDGGQFPSLQEVIMTGLSAGGQLTDRYAAGSALEDRYGALHFRYIIASPSSFMYLDSSRWTPGTQFEFAEPVNAPCSFNNYRYGLDGRNRYMSGKSADRMIADFRKRDIVIMVGDQDDATQAPNPPIPNDPKDGADLDVSCAGEYEGASRVERARVFKAYLDFIFPEKVHPLVVGPGIAHQLKLYSTASAQPWL
jgi:hypothetical protein